MGELRISDLNEPAIAWLDLPISKAPPASPARALAESCAPLTAGLRTPHLVTGSHGSTPSHESERANALEPVAFFHSTNEGQQR